MRASSLTKADCALKDIFGDFPLGLIAPLTPFLFGDEPLTPLLGLRTGECLVSPESKELLEDPTPCDVDDDATCLLECRLARNL